MEEQKRKKKDKYDVARKEAADPKNVKGFVELLKKNK